MEHDGKRSYDVVMAYFGQITKESERGQVLLSCSFLEDTLGRMLKGYLRETDSSDKLLAGFNAPLGSFSARISACSALGLLTDDEAKEIDIHRKIRNKFAHIISMNFENRSIVYLCDNLRMKTAQVDKNQPKAIENFLSSATQINLSLIVRLSHIPRLRMEIPFKGELK